MIGGRLQKKLSLSLSHGENHSPKQRIIDFNPCHDIYIILIYVDDINTKVVNLPRSLFTDRKNPQNILAENPQICLSVCINPTQYIMLCFYQCQKISFYHAIPKIILLSLKYSFVSIPQICFCDNRTNMLL